MKKIIFTILVAGFICSFAQAQIDFGAGVVIGTKASFGDDGDGTLGFGAQVRSDYMLQDNITISPNFSYFFPSGPDGIDVGLWELNGNVHYFFVTSEDGLNIYGLAGIAIASVKAGIAGISASDSEIGLNLGAGVKINPNIFVELKYDSPIEQLAITGGYMF